jgi:hypothetical protein
MSTAISTSGPVQAADPVPPPAPKGSPEPPAPAAAVPQDVVQLSTAAQAALREATETPAQTAKEAGHGDVQAKHLLAKQAAAKESAAGHKVHVVA